MAKRRKWNSMAPAVSSGGKRGGLGTVEESAKGVRGNLLNSGCTVSIDRSLSGVSQTGKRTKCNDQGSTEDSGEQESFGQTSRDRCF